MECGTRPKCRKTWASFCPYNEARIPPRRLRISPDSKSVAKNYRFWSEWLDKDDMVHRFISVRSAGGHHVGNYAVAGATLVCAHAGILRLCMGTPGPGVTFLGMAAGLAIGAGVLIRYRNDLVDC